MAVAAPVAMAFAGVARRGDWQAWLFVIAMLVGMGLFNVAENFRSRQGRV